MTPAQEIFDAIELQTDARWYSGRGMYGRECPAFEVDKLKDAFGVFVDIAFDDHALACEMAEHVAIDQLGLGHIVYFPRHKRDAEAA